MFRECFVKTCNIGTLQVCFGGLPPGVHEGHLREACAEYGPIDAVHFPRTRGADSAAVVFSKVSVFNTLGHFLALWVTSH
jgi:hypothetical protein